MKVERMSEEEVEEAARPTPHREPSNTNQTAARSPRRRVRLAVLLTSPCRCLQHGPCPHILSLTRSSTPIPTLTLTPHQSPTFPPFSITTHSTASLT